MPFNAMVSIQIGILTTTYIWVPQVTLMLVKVYAKQAVDAKLPLTLLELDRAMATISTLGAAAPMLIIRPTLQE